LDEYLTAHKEASSAQERQDYISLQSQIYHCAPEVAAYTDERKRSFFQRFLSSGSGNALNEKDLFLDGTFEDNKVSESILQSMSFKHINVFWFGRF
jgi:hypothetical protein